MYWVLEDFTINALIMVKYLYISYINCLFDYDSLIWIKERSGSVVECLTQEVGG